MRPPPPPPRWEGELFIEIDSPLATGTQTRVPPPPPPNVRPMQPIIDLNKAVVTNTFILSPPFFTFAAFVGPFGDGREARRNEGNLRAPFLALFSGWLGHTKKRS